LSILVRSVRTVLEDGEKLESILTSEVGQPSDLKFSTVQYQKKYMRCAAWGGVRSGGNSQGWTDIDEVRVTGSRREG